MYDALQVLYRLYSHVTEIYVSPSDLSFQSIDLKWTAMNYLVVLRYCPETTGAGVTLHGHAIEPKNIAGAQSAKIKFCCKLMHVSPLNPL